MNKFLMNEMANMYSLMGRMDKHLTKSQSEYYTFQTLNEAIAQAGNLLKPKSYISVKTDTNLQKEEIRIEIVGILKETADKIKSTSPYATDRLIDWVPTKGNVGVLKIRKYIPYGTSSSNANPQAQGQPAVAPVKKGLMGHLKPSGQAVNEGLMNRLKPASAQQGATPTTPATPNDSIRNWFDTYYKGIIDIIAQDPRYDKQDIDVLGNTNFIYNKFRATVSSEDESYVEKTSKKIQDEITESIRKGNWQTVLQSNIQPINIQSIVYGWTPSPRNHTAINHRISDYGLQPTDSDYPTLILGPEKWEKFFKRRVVDTPKHKYPMVHPNATKGKGKGMGTKGHYDHFGNEIGGYRSYYGYDITDTEPIDPSDTTDYVNGDLPGLKNNLTGDLNDAAQAERDAAIQAQMGTLSQAQQQALVQAQSEEGQAKLFNTELCELASKNGVRNLVATDNSSNPIQDYVGNVLRYSKHVVGLMQYGNVNITEPISFILAFALCCYTVGSDYLMNSMNSSMLRGNTLADAWASNSDKVLSTIQHTVNTIRQNLITKYGKYGGDEITDPSVAQPQPQQASVNENIINKINYLLENL